MAAGNVKLDVVEEHLDEAAFLAVQWERALVDPEYVLAEVAAGPEERLFAHLDGLVLNGPSAAEALLVPALSGDEPERVFAAACALLAVEEGDLAGPVLEALGAAEAEGRAAIVRALGVSPRADVGALAAPLLASGDPVRQAAALRVLASRRLDPGAPLDPFLAAKDPALRQAALIAARAFPERAMPHLVEAALDADDPEERALATEAGLVLRIDAAWAAVERDVKATGPEFARAARLWGLSGEPDVSRLVAALDDEARRGAALFALGFTGAPAAVDAAIPHLADSGTAKLAGEVVTSVTDLVLEGGYAKPPERWDPDAPEEEAAEEWTPEAELPAPDPLAVEGFWNGARERYAAAPRWQYGAPWSAGGLLAALESAPMRRRPALALDLAIRSRGVLRLDALAPARWQLADLAALRAVPARVHDARYRDIVRMPAAGRG